MSKPEPVAWLRDDGRTAPLAAITTAIKNLWLKAKPERVERYTIPLYDQSALDAAINAALEEAAKLVDRYGADYDPHGVTAVELKACAFAIRVLKKEKKDV